MMLELYRLDYIDGCWIETYVGLIKRSGADLTVEILNDEVDDNTRFYTTEIASGE